MARLPVRAPLDMQSQKITNLLDPTDPQDGATRAFVLANAGGTAYYDVPATGRTEAFTISAGDVVRINTSPQSDIDGIYLKLEGADVPISADTAGDTSLRTFATSPAVTFEFGEGEYYNVPSQASSGRPPFRLSVGDIITISDGGNAGTYLKITGAAVTIAENTAGDQTLASFATSSTLSVRLDGSGQGGHVIEAPNGDDLAQRANLQFTGNVSVTDDSANNRTVVNVTGGGGTFGNYQFRSVDAGLIPGAQVGNAITGASVTIDASADILHATTFPAGELDIARGVPSGDTEYFTWTPTQPTINGLVNNFKSTCS